MIEGTPAINITGGLIIIALAITVIIMDSLPKMHDKMFDDSLSLIRNDTPEGVASIVLVSLIALIIVFLMSISPLIVFKDIGSTIINLIKSNTDLEADDKTINGILLIIVFTIIILGLNVNSHDKMFDDRKKIVRTDTPEGIATIVFIP